MRIKDRNLFRITRFILLKLPGLYKFFAKLRSPKKRILIIKTDAIGDFILFRNFIEITKKSEIFKDHQVDLLGNKLWQDIATQYDSKFIGDFFFINPDELYEAPLTTFKLGWRLFKNNYETVLQPTFARTFINDGLAGLTAATQIIGFEGDAERINIKYKIKTDRFYTTKILLPVNIKFEFEWSRFFFENVLKQPVTINGPSIPVENSIKNGIIIFPGAGVFKRSWEPEKFIGLIKLILQHTSHPVYLAGGPAELQIGEFLVKSLPANSVHNLTGKTSLPQLVQLIGNAALIIANETAAIHIAAATQTKAVCILGGGHFGRFAPYPDHILNKPLCIYEKMECYNCNWNCIYQTIENEPYPCISNVSLEKVWQAVSQLRPVT
jgi:ADP-heptose:LPS heptosyltransferase